MWLDFRSLIRRSWRRSLIRVGARLVRLWRGGMRLWLGCILTPNPAQLTGWWRLSCPALVSHVISQRRQRPFCRQWHRDRPSVAPLPLQRIKFRIFGEVCESDLYLKYHIFQRAAQGAQRKLSYSPFPVSRCNLPPGKYIKPFFFISYLYLAFFVFQFEIWCCFWEIICTWFVLHLYLHFEFVFVFVLSVYLSWHRLSFLQSWVWCKVALGN